MHSGIYVGTYTGMSCFTNRHSGASEPWMGAP